MAYQPKRKREQNKASAKRTKRDISSTVFGSSEAVSYVVDKEDQARENRRLKQKRYRQRLKNYGEKLEQDTKNLREELERLVARRQASINSISRNMNVWSVVAEYFRLFRHGLKPTSELSLMSITIPNHQLEFLLESMSPNIVFNTRIGLGSVVNYWKWVSHSFSDFEMELKSLEKDVEGCLAAQTTVNLTITKSTIQKLFPHLWRGENLNASGAPTSSVVRSLLGKPIVMHNWIRFEWDPTYHQITSITSTSDLLMPIIKLLGDLDSVSFLFDKAFVSPDFDGR